MFSCQCNKRNGFSRESETLEKCLMLNFSM